MPSKPKPRFPDWYWRTFEHPPEELDGTKIEVFAKNRDRLLDTGERIDLHSWATFIDDSWYFKWSIIGPATLADFRKANAVWRPVVPPSPATLRDLGGA